MRGASTPTGAEIAAIQRSCTPPSTSMVSDTTPSTATVPRSGCARIATAGTAVSMSGKKSSRSPSRAPGVREKCRASTSTRASFMNSDGWIDAGPTRIQRREPPPIRPRIGTASTARSTST